MSATVLAGFGESLAAIESVRSLLAARYDVVVFAREDRRIPLDHQDGVTVVRIPDPRHRLSAAVAGLQALLDVGPDAVLPLDDVALAVLLRAQVNAPTVVAGPVGHGALVALDKRLQLAAATAAGFAVPPTVVLEDPGSLPPDVPLPAVVKPALAVEVVGDRVLKASGAVCASRSELEAAVRSATAKTPLLVQPLLHGVGVGVFGLGVDHQSRAMSGHERVRMMNPSGSGASACRRRQLPPAEVEATRRLVASLGWSSLFMVELLRPETGPAWFMELNGRTWGSMALARRQGHEYPRWAVDHALGRAEARSLPLVLPPVAGVRETLLVRHLGRELVHLMAVLRFGARAPGWPTRRAAARSVLRVGRGDAWYNLERGSVGVFLADTWRCVTDQVKRARR